MKTDNIKRGMSIEEWAKKGKKEYLERLSKETFILFQSEKLAREFSNKYIICNSK